MDEDYYGNRFAEHYDAWFTRGYDVPGVVDRLAELAASAGRGPALELGIGTGAVALPLADRGVEVHGIDGCAAMVAQLRAKAGGHRIPVTIGDFGDVSVEHRYALVYCANGTFFELPTQDAQVRCFENVAKRLAPGGVFAVDGVLPDLWDGARRPVVVPGREGSVALLIRSVDRAAQRYVSDYLVLDDGDVRHVRVRFRYAVPAELDLMARQAGLRLRDRWSTWRGAPFDARSAGVVSVYELPG